MASIVVVFAVALVVAVSRIVVFAVVGVVVAFVLLLKLFACLHC